MKTVLKSFLINSRDYLCSLSRIRTFKRRKRIGREFTRMVNKVMPIISWRITGSTARRDFGFTSDLDIDILIRGDANMSYLTTLRRAFMKKYNLLIDCIPTSIEELKTFLRTSKKEVKEFYEEFYGIRFSDLF